jgi:predicted MPP superfamily phosphohydrolase
LLLLAVLLLGALFCWTQQNLIQIDEVVVSSDRLPAAFNGLRIAVVSDLHGKQFGTGNATLLQKLKALSPDLIAITGDVVDDASQISMLPDLARSLTAIAPTYYVTGNHEWAIRQARTVKSLLKEGGVTALTNTYVTYEKNTQTLVLAGVDDPNGLADQKTPEELADEIYGETGGAFWVLLAHRNEPERYAMEHGPDLTLCGHAHGGIIRLPFVGGLLGTDRKLFPKYTSGLWSTSSGGTVFISRGLGNVRHTLRLFNRPELSVVVLRGTGA